jgi:hypothetical protein
MNNNADTSIGTSVVFYYTLTKTDPSTMKLTCQANVIRAVTTEVYTFNSVFIQ